MKRQLRVFFHHLKLRMIDNNPPIILFRFSIQHHLLPCGNHLAHVRHVEPTAGQPRKTTTRLILDDRFIKPLPAKSFPLRIQNDSPQTHRRTSGLCWKRVKAPPIFVALRQPIQQLLPRMKTSLLKGLPLPGFQSRKIL